MRMVLHLGMHRWHSKAGHVCNLLPQVLDILCSRARLPRQLFQLLIEQRSLKSREPIVGAERVMFEPSCISPSSLVAIGPDAFRHLSGVGQDDAAFSGSNQFEGLKAECAGDAEISYRNATPGCSMSVRAIFDQSNVCAFAQSP